MVFLFRSWYVMLWVSKLLKREYSSWKLHTTFRKFYGRHTDIVHKFVRKCSLFLEHLLSPQLGSSWFHPFIIYALHNLSVWGLCLRINESGLFAWINLLCLGLIVLPPFCYACFPTILLWLHLFIKYKISFSVSSELHGLLAYFYLCSYLWTPPSQTHPFWLYVTVNKIYSQCLCHQFLLCIHLFSLR